MKSDKKIHTRITDPKPYGPAAKRTRRLACTALVSGSFDPVTIGHMMLVDYAAKRFKKVYVTVFVNENKTSRYSMEERVEMLKSACAKYKNVTVDSFGGMLWEYAKDHGVRIIVRGLRGESERAYENELARFNENALPGLKTELVPCGSELSGVSSTCVRAILDAGQSPEGLVPKEAMPLLEAAEERRKAPQNEEKK